MLIGLKRYLEERKGVDSLIRLQSLLTLFFSFVVIVWQMVNGIIYFELDLLLITASFAPKALQKFAEASLYRRSENKQQKEKCNE